MSMVPRRLACLGPHGFHQLAYWEWPGPPGARTVLCVHGLTRNGRDFDALAEALSAEVRVICPDFPGRGQSAWLKEPGDYGYPLYLADMAALIARLDVETVDWVGTSMGGLTGMLLAAQPGAPIRRLVVNDIGPLIAKEGLARIGSYVGRDPSFADAAALEAALRQIAARLRPAERRAVAPSRRHQRAAQARRQLWASPMTRISATPSATRRPRISISGRNGTPSPARPWCCAARNPICCAPRTRRP